jgi:hypothetical protein
MYGIGISLLGLEERKYHPLWDELMGMLMNK